MSTDQIIPIGGTGEPDRTAKGPAKTDSAEFRRLLERLEKLSTKSEETVVKDTKGLADALRKAEDGPQNCIAPSADTAVADRLVV